MTITLENVQNALAALNDMFDGLPKKTKPDYLGYMNEISLILEELERRCKKKDGV